MNTPLCKSAKVEWWDSISYNFDIRLNDKQALKLHKILERNGDFPELLTDLKNSLNYWNIIEND